MGRVKPFLLALYDDPRHQKMATLHKKHIYVFWHVKPTNPSKYQSKYVLLREQYFICHNTNMKQYQVCQSQTSGFYIWRNKSLVTLHLSLKISIS